MPPKRRVDNINKSYIDENNNNSQTTSSSPDQTPMIIEKEKKRKFEEISNNKVITTTTTTNTMTTNNNNNNNNDNNNNNNNNNVSIFDSIDINGLNKNTKDGLIIIAKSIGISTLTGNKSDIIKRIENSVQNYKSSNRKQNKQQSALVNRFDSTSYNLPIKNIEHVESLFWKIFRNKWLFLYLISFLKNDYQFDSFGYSYFINVRTMVLSGESKYGLLKDKVITNRSLVFDSIAYYSNEYLVKLFKIYRNDIPFLQSLFKNYFKLMGTMDKIVDYILESNSIVALQILIDQYNYVPTVKSTLYQAIFYRCSIKTLEFIIGKIGHRNVTSQINENLDEFYQQHLLNCKNEEAQFVLRDYHPDEVIKKQTEWAYHNLQSISRSTIGQPIFDQITIHRFKLVNYLIDQKLISLPSNSSISKITESFNIGPIEKQFLLKDLINSCKSIIILSIDESNLLSLKEINQMELKFTKQELNSKLLSLFDIGSSVYRDNQDIKQLFEFYIQQSTFKNNKVYYYLIYGATVEQFEKIQSSLFYYPFNLITPKENYFYYALKVGSVEFLQVYFSKNIDSNTNIIPKIENILFSQIPLGGSAASKLLIQERKVNFIKQYIENVRIAKEKHNLSGGYQFLFTTGYPLFYIFCLIIATGDVELISEFHKLTNGDFSFSDPYQHSSYYYRYQYNPLLYCKSPDMAEFLFNNYRESLFEPIFCPYQQQNVVRLDFSWYFSGEIEILKRMEKIIDSKDYPKYLPSIHPMDLYNAVAFNVQPAITPPGITKTMCHMIDNPLIYKELTELDLYHLCAIPNDQKCVEEIKYIIENTNIKYNMFELFPQQETYQNGKRYTNFKYKRQLLHWVFEKRKGDLLNGRYRIGYASQDQSRAIIKQFSSLYLVNKLDELFSDSNLDSFVNGMGVTYNHPDATLFDLIALAIGANGDINTFERILKMDINNIKPKKSFIFTVLQKSIEVGRIDFLEYLFENQKQLLAINSKKDTSGLFDQKEFKQLVTTAITHDRLSIVEFFFEFLGFKLPSPQILKIFKDINFRDIVYNNYKLKFGLK